MRNKINNLAGEPGKSGLSSRSKDTITKGCVCILLIGALLSTKDAYAFDWDYSSGGSSSLRGWDLNNYKQYSPSFQQMQFQAQYSQQAQQRAYAYDLDYSSRGNYYGSKDLKGYWSKMGDEADRIESMREHKLKILVTNIIAAHGNLALAYIHKGDKKAAAEVHYRLGILFDRIEWNNFAMAEFKKGLSLNPKSSAYTYNTIGKLYGEIKEYEQARQTFEKALEIAPDSAAIHNNLGLAYLKQGLQEKAKKEFERAIELEPNFIDAHQNLAVYYYETSDYPKALEHWEAISKIEPNYPNLKKNIEWAKKNLQKEDKQVVSLEKMREMDIRQQEMARNNVQEIDVQIAQLKREILARGRQDEILEWLEYERVKAILAQEKKRTKVYVLEGVVYQREKLIKNLEDRLKLKAESTGNLNAQINRAKEELSKSRRELEDVRKKFEKARDIVKQIEAKIAQHKRQLGRDIQKQVD